MIPASAPQNPPLPSLCPRCRRPVDAADAHCRHCGRKLPRAGEVAWAYTPLGIIILTLTILGPISIGLVWRSPVLNKQAKWAFTAAIAAFTAILLYAFYWILLAAYDQFHTFNEELKNFN